MCAKRIVREIRITKPTTVRITREVTHYIRAWRRHRKLSVEKLAAEAGVSGSLISQLERGKTTYTQTTLEKLANVLDVQPWQLLACGPDENRELWNIVLSRGPLATVWSEINFRHHPEIEEALNAHAETTLNLFRSSIRKSEPEENGTPG